MPFEDSPTSANRTFYYVLSTHWDREWYEPFQYYRHRLVALLDQVIEGFRSGQLRGPFQTDGQAIILDDYLEIRPENRPIVEQLAKEGKLRIGPWFVLPDEFLISGESHIRNIRLGRKLAREYGTEPSNAGFICDLFGHISQMPQIFSGFGIEVCFLWRGINLDDKRNLIWTGADGTEMVCYRFGNVGYCDYSFKVRDANRPRIPFEEKESRHKLENYMELEAKETEVAPVLLFDGGDHQEWDQKVYGVLTDLMDELDESDSSTRIVHADLDTYAEALFADRDSITVKLEGELREPGKNPERPAHQIPGVMSSRVWIKQRNRNCESMLTQWAEPFTLFVNRLLGVEVADSYLEVAWRHLLENHPHDSICGCSVDTVHEDMKYRFSQTEQIAERLTMDATRRIIASVGRVIEENELRIGLFNPVPVVHRGPVILTLEIPNDWPDFHEYFDFERLPSFKLFDADENEIPYHRLGQTKDRKRSRIRWERFPEFYRVHEVRVALEIEIPAQGYTTIHARPGEQWHPTRYASLTSILRLPRSMQNGYLRVSINESGTVDLTDLETGETYSGILVFEDCADIGDGWYHGVTSNDEIYTSQSCASHVSVVESCPLTAAIRISTKMEIPARFDFSTMHRSKEKVTLEIETTLRLNKGSKNLLLTTKVCNIAADHRVRVFFATQTNAEKYYTDTPFDVVERPVGLRPDNHEYMELEVETRPQQSFVCVSSDQKRGLAVVAKGLMESCVTASEDRPIALTLFRSTRRTVNTDGEPEGLLLNWDLEFEYLVTPFQTEDEFPRLIRTAQALEGRIRAEFLRTGDQDIYRSADVSLPPCGGQFQVEGDAILTSSRRILGHCEVRLYNPMTMPITSRLCVPGFKSASRVDFESNELGAPEILSGNYLVLNLKPKEIVTYKLL